MSRWTHVAGIVRIDSMGHVFGAPTEWVTILNARIAGNRTPTGSEGPLGVTITDLDSGAAVYRGFVTIEGDLRDFGNEDNVDSIREWVAEVFVDGLKLLQERGDDDPRPNPANPLIRQGIIQVGDERHENSVLIVFDTDRRTWGYTI